MKKWDELRAASVEPKKGWHKKSGVVDPIDKLASHLGVPVRAATSLELRGKPGGAEQQEREWWEEKSRKKHGVTMGAPMIATPMVAQPLPDIGAGPKSKRPSPIQALPQLSESCMASTGGNSTKE